MLSKKKFLEKNSEKDQIMHNKWRYACHITAGYLVLVQKSSYYDK